MTVSIKVEGLAKLNRELRKVEKDLPKKVKAVSKDAAQIVAVEAKMIVPTRTGRLQRSIRAGATADGADVRAGGRGTPYARVIHFGWPRHHIRPNPFVYAALDRRRDEVIRRFEKGVNDLIETSVKRGTGGGD